MTNYKKQVIVNLTVIELLNEGEVKVETQKLAKIFKALSNQNRLELYLNIAEVNEKTIQSGCECFVTDIIDCLNIGAPTISHHIKELVNADLIFTEKKGKFLICKINKEIVAEVRQILDR